MTTPQNSQPLGERVASNETGLECLEKELAFLKVQLWENSTMGMPDWGCVIVGVVAVLTMSVISLLGGWCSRNRFYGN